MTNFTPPLCVIDLSTIPATRLWCVNEDGSVTQARGIGLPITEVSTAVTASAAHYTILCNASAAGISVIPRDNFASQILNIKKIDASINTVIVSATIDNSGSLVLSNQYDSATIQFDGTNWWII